jgi:hypothetical protein
MLLKGGDKMKRARELMVETMEAHSTGKRTNDAANVMHKLGNSVALNQFAERAMINATTDKAQREMLDEAQGRIKEL